MEDFFSFKPSLTRLALQWQTAKAKTGEIEKVLMLILH